MEKLKLKNVLIPTASLFVICFITTLLLCSTNILTKDTIKNQEIQASESIKKVVLQSADSFKAATSRDGSFEYFIGVDKNKNIIGYVFSTQAKGYGGTVEVMTGINTDSQIENVAVLSHNETPGLGANVTKDSFLNQFNSNISGGYFSITKNTPYNDREVEAVTGATISSTAVTKAVNEAVKNFNSVIKTEGSN